MGLIDKSCVRLYSFYFLFYFISFYHSLALFLTFSCFILYFKRKKKTFQRRRTFELILKEANTQHSNTSTVCAFEKKKVRCDDGHFLFFFIVINLDVTVHLDHHIQTECEIFWDVWENQFHRKMLNLFAQTVCRNIFNPELSPVLSWCKNILTVIRTACIWNFILSAAVLPVASSV